MYLYILCKLLTTGSQESNKVTKKRKKVWCKKKKKWKLLFENHSFWSPHSTEQCICVSLQILETTSVNSSQFPEFFNRLGTFYSHMIKFFCTRFLIYELHHWLKSWKKLANNIITNQKLPPNFLSSLTGWAHFIDTW